MKTSFAAAAILIIFALATPSAPAQQGTGAFQCIATAVVPGSSHATIYVSGMVPGDQSQRIAMTNAWSAYVRGAYPQQNFSTTLCNPGTADPANQQRVIAAEQSAWQRAGMEVVFVNWQPGQQPGNNAPKANTNPYATTEPPKDAPAAGAQAAPPPADPGPQPRTSYCYSDDKKPTVYFSDAFDTADLPSSKAWSTAFSKMLAEKYAYKGTVTCKDGDTIFNVQSTIRDQKDALQGKQTVDTDWTYEPPAPGDPAPADAPAPAKTAPPKHATTHKPQ
ncbi:MAG: hypothetical protein WB559_15840 [Candidatus Acidiferrales bacterium]